MIYTFIAVNYNNSYHSINYIESINKLITNTGKIEIIIVDNNSDADDYYKLVQTKELVRNVTFIRNETNIGYFKAINVGINSVPDKLDHLFIVGNNDLIFDNNFIVALNNISYDEKTLVLAPNIVTQNGYHQNPHCINRISFLRKIGYRLFYTNYYFGQFIYWIWQKRKLTNQQIDNNDCCQQIFIYMGIGACYVLTEHFFNYFEKLDDRVFLWGEEALLAGQVSGVGGKTLYVPNIVVHHKELSSVSKKAFTREYYKIAQASYKIYSRYL